MIQRIRRFLSLFAKAGNGFVNDNAFKLSASLSYYTVFALGPLLLIIISLAGIFFGREAVQGKIYLQLSGLVGTEAAVQIQNIIKNVHHTHSSTAGAIIGAVILVIGATGVFTEMQDSINYIWSVRAKPKKSWLKYLSNRLLSFSLVVGLGFLLLVSLVINALLNLLSDRLTHYFPNFTVFVFNWINIGIIVVAITGLFAVIYKVLPDAVISWRDAFTGALITALLFLLGKFGIGYYLARSNLDVTYGTAASIVIILSWIYYSALILFYGAEFTKMYALHHGKGIHPKETAVFIIKRESKEVPTSYLDT
ncbi:MAG: YihY/virulence factor BrkB family protein [Chitinophagaceae bacterium]|nr:MAG: YihY/virulence factor BrkB family protein [Chitinophagaceae bacterium]